jgi:RTX calcium-binding nonapeptide repeat (4 copies)
LGEGGRISRLPWRRAALIVCAALLFAGLAAEAASAEFPYSRNSSPSGYGDLWLNAGQVPTDLGGNTFKFAATSDPANTTNNANPVELGGVRGAHVVDADAAVQTAFQTTTGRPDVTIAVLDSGIKWNDAGAMNDLRMKTRISKGEAPKPRNDGLGTPNETGEDCSGSGPYTHPGDWDLNGDGVFNLLDYSCDDRVAADSPKGVGPPGMFEPQDLLIAFSDGVDDDGNGYVDDLVGWDFLDDDNDPFDDVQYGHGTGEAKDSMAEADNGGEVGSCPNCMAVYLRVGDSFVADVNRFGAAVTYATDNGVQIVQEALGTLNNSSLARDAVDYAYRHGVTVMASAADEAAQHNNWPSSLPHVIVANSVTDGDGAVPNKSYLAFNGCTNFGAKITVAIPSTACSSNAVGLAAGFAGLIYSAALNARDAGALDPYPDGSKCELVGGDPCPITPNEIRQLLASGTVDGTPQADDVDFAGSPPGSADEPSCTPTPLPDCTSPYGSGGSLLDQVTANRQVFGAPVASTSYPARRGFDQFYGYGRANVNRAVKAVVDDPAGPSDAELPPEADITSPAWFQEIDPARAAIDVSGTVFARGEPYRCSLEVAPGQYPNNAVTTDPQPGDFAQVRNGWCDGSTVHGAAAASAHKGVLGSIDVAALRQRFPAGTDFAGPIPPASAATGNGRPFFAPQAFTFRVVVEPTTGTPRTGQDQRAAWLHRDADLLNGFPRAIGERGGVGGPEAVPSADGASSPAYADLDGDNRNELVFADSNGFVHAIGPDGSELPGWPVRGAEPGFVAAHDASPAYASGAVGTDLGGAILGAVAVGDTDGDGIPEVYVDDAEGRIYGWAADGTRVFEEQSNPDWSGRPLTPFVNVRDGKANRTQHGFFGAPVLADLDGDGHQEVIAAAMDRHVYAWSSDDSDSTGPGGAASAPGYPVLVVDPAKVDSIDPDTHAISFRSDADPLMQGAIIDTPAVGDITGDGVPEVVVGTNEEYDEPLNLGNPGGLAVPIGLGLVDPGNSRLFALRAKGGGDADPLPTDALMPGWPFDVGMLLTETLPIVGEGISGPPVIGPVECASGGGGSKVAAATAAGPAYVVNGDGTSCYGATSEHANGLSADFDGSANATDSPLIPALGNPAFGAAGGAGDGDPAFVMGAIGLLKAVDLQVVDYQSGQDLVGVWDPATGQFRDGFPAAVNDLQLLTGPAVADVDGKAGEEVLTGSSSQDLAAFGPDGTAAAGWPKLTTDWTVATPLVGSFGTLDTKDSARKVVVGITRSGYVHAYETDAPACSPSSSPRFHHDVANSGDYSRDAVLPGAPAGLKSKSGTLTFSAPGDDLLCGKVDHYEMATAGKRIDEAGFADAKPLKGAPKPKAPGAKQKLDVPAKSKGWIAIRAVDEQGNVGRVAAVKAKPEHAGPGRRCVNPIPGTSGRDHLRGTGGGDELTGRGRGDHLDGRGGPDCVKGGKGNDRLRGGQGRDRIGGGAGSDRIDAADGRRDRIRCGPGRDRVTADRKDRVAGSCERVR